MKPPDDNRGRGRASPFGGFRVSLDYLSAKSDGQARFTSKARLTDWGSGGTLSAMKKTRQINYSPIPYPAVLSAFGASDTVQLAKALGLSRQTTWAWFNDGEVPPRRSLELRLLHPDKGFGPPVMGA